MSFFITFEGGEGCGKSTQTRALHKKLVKMDLPVILIREPGGTALGEQIRKILKKSINVPISPLTESILFNASRSQLVSEIVGPGLKSGQIVVCDRFTDSTVAYQCYGRGLNIQNVEKLNRLAAGGLKPDLTFLLDIAPETGLARKKGGTNDRFENEQIQFHQRVRQGFLEMAAREPRRWTVIDATLPKAKIFQLVWTTVSRRLKLNPV
ncbi:MAG TPA: dTMP kinase [Dehalococcoidales bacterium]|nr:dTMP kinase [Dehalococcoidales bacterium]